MSQDGGIASVVGVNQVDNPGTMSSWAITLGRGDQEEGNLTTPIIGGKVGGEGGTIPMFLQNMV